MNDPTTPKSRRLSSLSSCRRSFLSRDGTASPLPGAEGATIHQTIDRLGQRVARVRASMDELRELAEVPSGDFVGSRFALDTAPNGLGEERAKIRKANAEQARNLAESHLLSYCDTARRLEAQRSRMTALEMRTGRMETLFDEQIRLNQEIGGDALQALGRFATAEKQRQEASEAASALQATLRAEADKLKGRSELLEASNQKLSAQMEQYTKEKCDVARRLLECQNECHELRLAVDRMHHEGDTQSRLLHTRETLVAQLQERVQQCVRERDEAQARATHCTRVRDEVQQRLEQQLTQHQRQAEEWGRETQRKMAEEKAKIVAELCSRNEAELDRVQTEATNTQKRLTDMLKQAAEAHSKLEEERNQMFQQHKLLEDNLNGFKRRFVAELQRKMSTRCSQLGDGMNNVFLDVVGQLDFGNKRPPTTEMPDTQQREQQQKRAQPQTFGGGGADAVIAVDDYSPSPGSVDLSDSVFEPCENNRSPCRKMSSAVTALATGTESSSNNNKCRMLAMSTKPKQQQQREMDKENRRPPPPSSTCKNVPKEQQQQQRHASTVMSTAATSSQSVACLVQQRKRPTIGIVSLVPGLLPPPLPQASAVTNKRKSSATTTLTTGLSRTTGTVESSAARLTGKKVPPPMSPGAPSTSAAHTKNGAKFPAFHL
uniref:HMMR_C domain-containing protein n=1 Tax=Globodera pallida TaxID=36090 RepID=A0A183CK62_GLOPA